MANKKVKPSKKAVPKKRKRRVSNSDGIVPRGGRDNKGRFDVGNQWWNMRSTHGRSKLFESPQLMWEAAGEYFQWCRDNPLYESKAMGTRYGIRIVQLPKVRVFTLHGLCRYLDCNTEYFRNFKNQKREAGSEFSSVIRQIEETIYNQKFEHAACDQLNANIISRDLGLIDKKDITSGDEPLSAPVFNVYTVGPPLADAEDKVED